MPPCGASSGTIFRNLLLPAPNLEPRASRRIPCTRPPYCSRFPRAGESENTQTTQRSLRSEPSGAFVYPHNPSARALTPTAPSHPTLLVCPFLPLYTTSVSLSTYP